MPSISNGRNKTLFYGQYTRTKSYFSNSELASTGLPQRGRAEDPREVPRPDSGRGLHHGVSAARRPTAAATTATTCARRVRSAEGRRLGRSRTASCVNGQPGATVRVRDPARRSRRSSASSLPFVQNLERLGIKASVRTVDDRAVREPDRRLRLRHDRRRLRRIAVAGQRAARVLGIGSARTSRAAATSIGIKDPVVDELIEL